MDFLVRSRATPAATQAEDQPELDERHWSYMDGYAAALTARGPTLGKDRRTWTGSIHVVNLSGPDAVREFVNEEPYNRAGAYDQHFIWRFRNLLGKTMWDFERAADELRFFAFAHTVRHQPMDSEPPPSPDLPEHVRNHLIVYGTLHNLDDDVPVGVAAAVQVPTAPGLQPQLGDGLSWLGQHGDLEIHDWEFGGRR